MTEPFMRSYTIIIIAQMLHAIIIAFELFEICKFILNEQLLYQISVQPHEKYMRLRPISIRYFQLSCISAVLWGVEIERIRQMLGV